ncbi:TetR/AcrR family transcriptional regulator [Micromonospora endolithica]|uniref:TetR/AcrR family transcriptional regulator n=1 Tax=Micromonospora endolithica TaxID=230091 RepID=A0A3A9ZN16_9ACTN|nr:TetR/AcrR family transcriptional regulator [Micromonospora endolithica]RKN49304.1 TetR/AcrR family transcriptional regulator [Micromonospora endolithica]TWJ23485.1 TetR family transcriptional regulator [Micromonospora endolithica]
MTAPSRRERLRTTTVAEIKSGARRLLVDGGVEAVSLRAIARDMGMTAPAIYRYFPSLEALVGALAGDLYEESTALLEAARDGAGEDEVAQLLAMARAFRAWSVAHPAEFGLIFGAPTPSATTFFDTCADADHPGARFGAVFVQPLVELWHRSPFPTPPPELLRRHFEGRLEPLRQSHGEIPVEVAWAFLSGWTRLYGLVAMEVFDQVSWAITEPEHLFELELTTFATQLTPHRP